MVIGGTAGPAEVNIVGAYRDERQEHRQNERGRREKDISGGKEIADHTHDAGRGKAADRGEALIATEPFAERVVSDQSQTDGDDPEPENSSRRSLQDTRSEDGWEVRPQSKDQTRQSDGDASHSHEHSLRLDDVEELAGGNLGQQTCKATGG